MWTGRTQTLNFYTLGDSLYLVDMPGFGYTSSSLSMGNRWREMISEYILRRKALRFFALLTFSFVCVTVISLYHSLSSLIFLLIDSRRGVGETDQFLMNTLNEYGVPYQIILTKVDRVRVRMRDKVRKSQCLDCCNVCARRIDEHWPATTDACFSGREFG